jgi:hypothetical protein
MTTGDHVKRIALRFGLDRKCARTMYTEVFGRPCDDPAIDNELYGLFVNRRQGKNILVPAEIVLALIMRPPPGEGRGKKHPPLEIWKRRWRDLAVRTAEIEWVRRVRHRSLLNAQSMTPRSTRIRQFIVTD